MSIQNKINNDLQQAVKEKNQAKISALRLLNSALKNLAIEKRLEKDKDLPDEEVIKILKSQTKQLKDSIEDFKKAGRADLVDNYQKEIEILGNYLPEEMGENEIKKIIKQKIGELGGPERADFGKLMGAAMKEIGSRADGTKVRELVQQALTEK